MPTSHRAAVISMGRGKVTGIVGQDILVFPDMHPSRADQIFGARGIVAEVGGQLCHLAVVSREAGLTVMILPTACDVLQPGMRVALNPGRCEIIIDPE